MTNKKTTRKVIKGWAVIHDEYSELRYWAGKALISENKEDLSCYTGEGMNPQLKIIPVEIIIRPNKK